MSLENAADGPVVAAIQAPCATMLTIGELMTGRPASLERTVGPAPTLARSSLPGRSVAARYGARAIAPFDPSDG